MFGTRGVAESYTRLIEFKVKDGAIKSATERLFKSLDRIEKKLDQIGGKGGKGFTQVGKGADKAAASLKKLQATSNGVAKASGYLRASVVGLGAGLVASNAAVTALDRSLRKVWDPLGLVKRVADGTTGSLLAQKASFLATAAAAPLLTKALVAGAGAYVLFGSKIFNVKKQLTGFVDGVQKAKKTVREFIKGIRTPSGGGGGSELTIFDRIQSAKGGGLVGLRKLLDQVTAAQSKLISTNLGYVSSSEKVRAVEKALNAELMARKRIMDQIITNEQARTPTSTLTAAAGEAGGLEGLRQLLSEAQGIQDRMLTTNENYKVASARVRNIQKAINAELERRDKIMGKVNAKEQKSVTLGERLRGIAGNVGGKAVQAARPGRGIEGRGLLAGGLGGVAGYGMSANAASGTLAGKITGAASTAANWGAENIISNIPGLHGVGAGVSKTITDMTTLNTVARSVGETMAHHPVWIGSALAAWVVFGEQGIWKTVKALFGARDAAENTTKSIKKTTAGWFNLAQKTDVFGVSTKTANKLIGITNGLFKSQEQQLTLNTKAIKVLGHTAEETTKKLAAMGKNKGSVLRNISRSRAARSGSGFAAFSSTAGEYNPYQLQQSRGAGFGRGAGRDFSERFDFGITPSYSTGKIGPMHPAEFASRSASGSSAAIKSLERKNKRLVQLGQERLKGERLITKEVKKQQKDAVKIEKATKNQAKQRLKNWKRIRGQKAESLMLGAGFPMLFGGGLGAVGGGLGGSVLGNAMGMGGFGAQIIGSAVGTQLEALHNRVVTIGNATQTLNLDQLEESGIRVNAELELQINRLKKVGKFKEAEQLLDKKVFETTGGTGGVNKDIANNVAMLKNVWDGLLAAVGTTVGIIAAPFVTALAAVLKIVSEIFRIINAILSGVTWLIKKLVEGFINILPNGEQILEGIEKRFANINGALDDINMKFANWVDKMKEDQQLILDKITLGEKEALIQADIRAAVAEIGIEKKDQIETTVRALHATRDQYDQVKQTREAYKAIGTTIKDGIVNSLEAAIMKTKSLGEVASNVFRMMATQLLKMGINSALTGMFGGTGFGNFLGLGTNKAADTIQSVVTPNTIPNAIPRIVDDISTPIQLRNGNTLDFTTMAKGGPVKGGTPYIIGEEGPELFVPGSSGNIVPNHAMGGANVVVNVDASGSSVEGDAGQAEQLGSMLAAAVQAEIANQQRPGGLLARR